MTEAVTDRFSVELRTATRDAHRGAERGAYLDALLGGRLDRDGYAAMVAQHYVIYAALEATTARFETDPVVALFADPRLTRLPRLVADLTYLYGTAWPDRVEPTATTERYAARLRALDWPGGLVAHHYTRYLGDLSGGQYIATAVAGIYEFPDGAGTDFYDFSDLGDLSAFRDGYRDALDAAGWDTADRRRITDEVLLAYDLNTGVFADLARWA